MSPDFTAKTFTDMTLKTRLTIDLEFTSSCSEADLHVHIPDVVNQLKRYATELPQQSWNNRVSVSWDESFRVDTHVKIEQSKVE